MWRHTFYCAPFGMEHLRDRLEDHFGRDPSSFEQFPLRDSCLFALQVEADGRPILETLVLSSCAWALGSTETQGPGHPDWLEGFEARQEKWIDGVRRALEPEDAPGTWKDAELGRVVTAEELLRVVRETRDALGLADFLEEPTIRFTSKALDRNRMPRPVNPHINSFFLEDLERVIAAAEKDRLSGPLTRFLSEETPTPEERIDTRRFPRAVQERLAPEHFPVGRWPSPGGFPLAYGQQLAVNSVVAELPGTSGLFAVNGPPGTGKTTLLRDLVAALVVQRAERMADLEDPADAFGGEPFVWKTERYKTKIHRLHESLRGFEMVVASSNNGAVENITEEIPALKSVPEGCREAADYFPELAEALLENEAWALTAAKLGKMTYRNAFVNGFWFEDGNLRQYLQGVDRGAAMKGWSVGVREFRRALKAERVLRNRRQQSYEMLLEAETLEQRRIDDEDALQGLELDAQEARDVVEAERMALERALARERAARERRDRHRRDRPVLWEILGSLGRDLWEWIRRGRDLSSAWREVRNALEDAEGRFETAQEALNRSEREVETGRAALRQAQADLDAHRRDLRREATSLGDHWPLDGGASDGERELSAPWSDPQWRRARADVFVAALRLHKALLTVNAKKVGSTLSAAVDLLKGKVPERVEPAAAQAAWQSLFLVVPVISTTFASAGNLFKHLGREALGWLLIDEAGQAPAAAAVGALWRARRAVVVGDPLQLEPIHSVPLTVQETLRQPFGVAETWIPRWGSVQRLADRQATWGTALTVERDEIWIGSPLRVHRRCDRPMFGISNDVAYEGLMVFGVPGERPTLSLAQSAWLDVKGEATGDSHWIEAEGQVVDGLVRRLLSEGTPADRIFLLSPFLDVVDQLKRRQKGLGLRDATVGTIHTAQGKEADVVVMVLGGNPARPGAKNWAAETPNLLNVVVSRARRRFYVVGDRTSWMQRPYFSVAAERLPRVETQTEAGGGVSDRPPSADTGPVTLAPAAANGDGHRHKPQVFLSYAKADREHASRLWHALREQGLEVWWDERNLLPGEEWKYAVHQAIEGSEVFVTLLSSHAVRKRGYVQVEIRKAIEIADEFPPGEIWAIPVRLDDCEPAHPALKNWQWVDLFPSFDDGLQRILLSLRSKGLLD